MVSQSREQHPLGVKGVVDEEDEMKMKSLEEEKKKGMRFRKFRFERGWFGCQRGHSFTRSSNIQSKFVVFEVESPHTPCYEGYLFQVLLRCVILGFWLVKIFFCVTTKY
jgi:hypothetical protein